MSTKRAEKKNNKPAPIPPKGSKGEQARVNLKRAAMRVLEREGYHLMRVADVTKEADVATGLFYRYFKDLRSLTVEVLSDFLAISLNPSEVEKNVSKGDWYERIYAYNHLVVTSYAKHTGIMRCIFQLADEDTEFSNLLHTQFVEQLNWLVKLMPKLFPDAAFKRHQALMIIYSLAGSSERILRDYYLNNESSSALQKVSITEKNMTELLTVIFYRGLFLKNPPIEKLSYMANADQIINTRFA